MNVIDVIVGRTSENAKVPGLYESDCCNHELLFAEDDCFCRCPKCERLCEWELTEPATSAVALAINEDEAVLDCEYALGA